ncbi:MAG: HAMP domain-containing protein [Myxococcales bacterium]|nr:HAMP domain-containing protein [Myxococcales bacterium]
MEQVARRDKQLVPWWRSFAFRFVALYTSVAIAVLVAGVIKLHHDAKAEVVKSFGAMLQGIAATGAPFIDARDLSALRSNADAKSAAFGRVRALLARIERDTMLGRERIYVLRPVPGKRDVYRFCAMLQERTFIGDEYTPPPLLARLYRKVFTEKVSVRSPLFMDKHGTFISGVAPISDAAGKVVAMLHADLGVDRYLSEVERRTRVLLLGVAAVTLLFIAFGWWMHRRLFRAARDLMAGTDAIEQERYDHTVQVRGRDELARVGEALNHALRKLKERFEMLKFIPDHTARMIERALHSAEGVNLEIARRVEVAVFESDIRGFTRLSERLSAEEVVAMLNLFIRAQAELVQAAGGSIDKYMGDAVLAVFEGERKEQRALECSLAIQRAVFEMNSARAGEEPVNIGIGLTVGEVVMGNMGSERRMEHTIIGSSVNLAARLCSQARAGEIVFSEQLAQAARDSELEIDSLEVETVTVKGFAEPVRCYRAGVICALPG